MKRYLIALTFSVIVILSLTGCVGKYTNGEPNYEDMVITLERTPCYGFCPVYKLTIQGNGNVVYEGEDFVKTKGIMEISIPKAKIDQLVEEFERVGYFSLNNYYTERTITDAPSVITSITVDGKTKTIEHYHGDFDAPEELTELEDAIDEIVNSDQWIK